MFVYSLRGMKPSLNRNETEGFKLGQLANTSSTIVRKYTFFMDSVKALVNYAKLSAPKYPFCLKFTRTTSFVDDTVSSEFIMPGICETHNRNVQPAGLPNANHHLLQLVKDLSSDSSA